MANYTKNTNFTAKDSLLTTDPEKTILGSDFDAEFDELETAGALKEISANKGAASGYCGLTSSSLVAVAFLPVATETAIGCLETATAAESAAGTATDKIMVPDTFSDAFDPSFVTSIAAWATDNASVIEHLQAITAPGADVLYGWDFSASTSIGFSLGAGLSHAGTTIDIAAASAGAGMTMTSSVLNVIGGVGITANANDIALTAASASTTNPINVVTGTIGMDLEALTTIEGNALAATDTFLVDDGGTPKGIEVQDMGLRVQLAQTTQTLAAADMNSIMEFTATATLTLPINSGVALPIGVPIVLNMKHATQVLTVTAATSVTLVSTFHPGGGSAASDTVLAGGTAILYKSAADVWCIAGDIST